MIYLAPRLPVEFVQCREHQEIRGWVGSGSGYSFRGSPPAESLLVDRILHLSGGPLHIGLCLRSWWLLPSSALLALGVSGTPLLVTLGILSFIPYEWLGTAAYDFISVSFIHQLNDLTECALCFPYGLWWIYTYLIYVSHNPSSSLLYSVVLRDEPLEMMCERARAMKSVGPECHLRLCY